VAGEQARGEPFLGDRLPASFADAVPRSVHPAQRIVELGDSHSRGGQQRGQLSASEPDGGALRVVFVVGVRVPQRGGCGRWCPGSAAPDLAGGELTVAMRRLLAAQAV
jgi:hypothetical protein